MFHCRITDKSLVAQVCNRFMNIDINMIACRTTGTEDSSLRTQTVLGGVAQIHATLSVVSLVLTFDLSTSGFSTPAILTTFC